MRKEQRRRERRWLVKALESIFVRALKEQRFEAIAFTDEEVNSWVRTAHPFGRFRRTREGGFDVVTIQLAEYGRPAFRLAAGVVPSVGVNHPATGYVAAEALWPAHLPTWFEFCDIPVIGRWFSLWHWPSRRIKQDDIESLVSRITTVIIPEMEMALREGRGGKHTRIVRAY